ncbi:hypothetical protein [Coralloluteibacterium thermophilus]|uniref:Uncharacterized protein n=1 Tax=Coralloluteibacterium thermophilum TaxID=2707049 RepID=A0ABV9NJG3_9GAMM
MNTKIAIVAASIVLGTAIAAVGGHFQSESTATAPATQPVRTLPTVTVTPDPADLEWVARARAQNIPVLETIQVRPTEAELAAAFALIVIDEAGRIAAR